MRIGIATFFALSALLLGGVAVGCGDDSSSESSESSTVPLTKETGQGSGSAPASAGDKPDQDAPDNVISDRPGGPNDKGKEKSPVPGPPVSPAPAK